MCALCGISGVAGNPPIVLQLRCLLANGVHAVVDKPPSLHCLLSRAKSLLWRSGRSVQGPAATCPSLRRRQRQKRRGERPQQPRRMQMQRLYQPCSSDALLCAFPSSDRRQLPTSWPTPPDTLQVVTPDRTAINPAVDPHQTISICLKLGASRTNRSGITARQRQERGAAQETRRGEEKRAVPLTSKQIRSRKTGGTGQGSRPPCVPDSVTGRGSLPDGGGNSAASCC